MGYLLALYLIFILIYVTYSAIGIYHLWRFGYVGDLTRPVMVIYLVVSGLIVAASLVLVGARMLV